MLFRKIYIWFVLIPYKLNYMLGAFIRLDTTLVDFNEMHWERGDITFLYRGDGPPESSLFVLDNKLRVFQKVTICLPAFHSEVPTSSTSCTLALSFR